jgi:formate/nitrite transporter FocA (FNT family)
VLVIITGTELFTGNVLFMTVGLLSRTTKISRALLNLALSFVGNWVGCVVYAFLSVYVSDMNSYSNNFWSNMIFKKILDQGWGEYLVRGVFCNILVCAACFLSLASETIEGKILGIWWPIFAFVAMGEKSLSHKQAHFRQS